VGRQIFNNRGPRFEERKGRRKKNQRERERKYHIQFIIHKIRTESPTHDIQLLRMGLLQVDKGVPQDTNVPEHPWVNKAWPIHP
jgi:hypothetical protein